MKLTNRAVVLAGTATALLAAISGAAEPSRQDSVRELSADVMPFGMAATSHVFTKTPPGGTQKVIAKDPGDATQQGLIRAHLKELADKFSRRDFSGPTHVHGAEMPGLVVLRSAKSQDLRVTYRDVPAGAEIEYASDRPNIVSALHDWFAAQLADHGADAMSGHDHAMHRPQ